MIFSTSLIIHFIILPVIISMGNNMNGYLQLTAKWRSYTQRKLYIPRSGHTSFVIDRVLYTFGGYTEKNQQTSVKRYPINDLIKIMFQPSPELYGEIEEMVQIGEVPSKRLVSASAVLNGRAYLFGGWDSEDDVTGGSVFFDTIHMFDPTNKEWTKLSATIPDGGMSRHVVFALPSRSKIVIHTHRCLNFVYVFDPVGSVVKQPTKKNEEAPSSRGLHACCMLDDVHCVMFGGAAQDGTMSNESFLLNTHTWEWSKLKIEQSTDTKRGDSNDCNIPRPRAGHNLVRFSNNAVVLFGGAVQGNNGLEPLNDLWVLHVNTTTGCGSWRQIDYFLDEKVPSPRNAATLTEIHSQEGSDGGQDKLYALVGGWSPFRHTFNDNFILSISSRL